MKKKKKSKIKMKRENKIKSTINNLDSCITAMRHVMRKIATVEGGLVQSEDDITIGM